MNESKELNNEAEVTAATEQAKEAKAEAKEAKAEAKEAKAEAKEAKKNSEKKFVAPWISLTLIGAELIACALILVFLLKGL